MLSKNANLLSFSIFLPSIITLLHKDKLKMLVCFFHLHPWLEFSHTFHKMKKSHEVAASSATYPTAILLGLTMPFLNLSELMLSASPLLSLAFSLCTMFLKTKCNIQHRQLLFHGSVSHSCVSFFLTL